LALAVIFTHIAETVVNSVRPHLVPHLLLQPVLLPAANPDALGILAFLVDVFVHGVIAASHNVLLPVSDTAAAVFEAERTEVAPAACVCAVKSVAPVPVRKGHLAAWAVHGEDLFLHVLARFEDIDAFELHLLQR
jgi:hypothetical protein